MTLHVIGSSSEGNAYVLQNASEALLLEAGKPFKGTLQALGGNVSKVVGCLISHEHGDHASHVADVLNYAIPVYASQGTKEGANKYTGRALYGIRELKRGPYRKYEKLQLGGFTIIPFETKHDANDPTGFYIWHAETGGVLFATDTYYLPCTFRGLSNILIECNYDPDILDRRVVAGDIPAALRERVTRSHLSYYTCLQALSANDLSAVNNIVLIHVSEGNGDAEAFRQGIANAYGKATTVARPGTIIELNKTPF